MSREYFKGVVIERKKNRYNPHFKGVEQTDRIADNHTGKG